MGGLWSTSNTMSMVCKKNSDHLSKDLVIVNDLGLHARSAAKLAKLALTATGRVWIEKAGETVDASSLIDILTLACPKHTKIRISIENLDDAEILERMAALVRDRFGEY